MPATRFCLVLIKPSHYDDDGYVIQWFRSAIPSNSLAALYGLARDSKARRILGDTDIDIDAIDETNDRVRVDEIAKRIHAAGSGMVMMVGVQSNQFPRALDLSKKFLARGVKVAIGGFHVSGTISMLDGKDAGLQEAKSLGITLFAGEAEGRLDEVLIDAHRGELKPFYNYMNDLPNIAGTPIPLITALRAWRTAGGVTSFDAGRGCPFQCSFCTIINVQGRKSRKRSPDDIEQIVRENVAQGLHSFFITDDNFARNSDWEPILDRLIKLKEEEGIKIHFIIQVDTLCHKIPNFIEKCARAGVRRVFIGLENINPDSLIGAKKRQNKITEYRKMLLAWKAAKVITYAGYILGFPGDTKESIRHDIEIIKRELPVDVLEFFFLTPLPGSEDHQVLFRKGAPLDPDLNKYDLNHVCTTHPRMSQQEWEETYRMAWQTYYTKDHIEAVLRRNIRMGASASNAILLMLWFGGSIHIEGVHPLEAGLFRKKVRTDRRAGFPIVPAWRFYPSYVFESISKLFRWAEMYAGLRLIYMRCKRDPKRYEYSDTALLPVTDEDVETLELFHNPRVAPAAR
jgi:radical SAM superfamily enzyme YgiQ (UPF0313 family)